MTAKEQNGPEDSREASTSAEFGITDLYRGPSKEGNGRFGYTTLSVWAATLILCAVLLFGLHQTRGRLQGIQARLEKVGQDNKLLLEGLDELLARAERPSPAAETAPPSPEPPDESEQSDAEEGGSEDLARRYKIYYRTKDGEDLALISEKFNVSEDQLRLWNALKPSDSLIPGQVLVINKRTQEGKPVLLAQAPSPPDDRVEAKLEEPVEEEPPPQELVSKAPPQSETEQDEPVTEATSVGEPGVAVGTGEILAEDEEKPAPEPLQEVAEEPADETVHIVRQGESLSAIGQSYGVSWLDLATLNGIEPTGTIYVGQRLRIREVPDMEERALPTSEITHMVKRGENLYRIGLAYDLGWEQIARANGITHPSQLYAGQVLKIPVAKGGPER